MKQSKNTTLTQTLAKINPNKVPVFEGVVLSAVPSVQSTQLEQSKERITRCKSDPYWIRK